MITLEDIKNNFAKEIKEAMKWSGVSQPQLAKKLNVTQQAISKYISGKALPTFDVFANLCVVLELDANEVLNIITERKNAK